MQYPLCKESYKNTLKDKKLLPGLRKGLYSLQVENISRIRNIEQLTRYWTGFKDIQSANRVFIS